jgi:hypothetical protein
MELMIMVATSSQKNSFPRKELNDWLKGRPTWNHEDWLNLLKFLRQQGYSKWTDTEKGRTEIGQYLEKERD